MGGMARSRKSCTAKIKTVHNKSSFCLSLPSALAHPHTRTFNLFPLCAPNQSECGMCNSMNGVYVLGNWIFHGNKRKIRNLMKSPFIFISFWKSHWKSNMQIINLHCFIFFFALAVAFLLLLLFLCASNEGSSCCLKINRLNFLDVESEQKFNFKILSSIFVCARLRSSIACTIGDGPSPVWSHDCVVPSLFGMCVCVRVFLFRC